ncbi:ATP-binding cassette domain-containing protein, partial [Oscillospiraceae bacterium OttesenSCG-928-F05]|nr:ATP-binding cassette domain-containing protein [Oscillospiraceae bacterium OttesenSCG-928-F05]
EPLAELDPVAARRFVDMLRQVRAFFDVTVVIAEQRLEGLAELCDRTVVLEAGELRHQGETEHVFRTVFKNRDPKAALFIPEINRARLLLNGGESAFPPALGAAETPVNKTVPRAAEPAGGGPVLSAKGLYYTYPEAGRPCVRDLSIAVAEGECLALLGGNGAGKTTLLKLLAGLLKPEAGKVRLTGEKIGYLPQDVQSFFRFETVAEELRFSGGGAPDLKKLEKLKLAHLLGRHPMDLSGGEMQLVALFCLLSGKPDILLLDEPARGADPYAASAVFALLKEAGCPVVFSTHDMALAAREATRCALMFDGNFAREAETAAFFRGNRYYTTPIARALREYGAEGLLLEDVGWLWERDVPSFLLGLA